LSAPIQAGYRSNILRLFVEELEKRRNAQVLDAGPTCSENINFLARRVRRLYVCDLFVRLDKCLRESLPTSLALSHLDYPPKTFDGILLWELADRLEDNEVSGLVKLCHNLLKQGGLLMVVYRGDQRGPAEVNAFVIGEDSQIHLRPQPHLDLPRHGRQYRKMLTMFSLFNLSKSFVYRGGIKEFLFKRG
jgi:hypothetical protein